MSHRARRPRRSSQRLAVLVLCAVAVTAAAVAFAAAPADAGPPPAAYVPPVDAPVHDPFRAPAGPYGPGNRGLEYDTAPGTEVRASADGRVTFAGLVAGSRHVTVLHPDGLRTTYSFLERVDVVVGQRLSQGDVVGTTAGRLHLGARSGDSYLDPASLFGGGPPRVHLVPFDEPPGGGQAGERSAIGQLIGGIGGALGDVVGGAADGIGALGEVASWLRDEGPQLLGTLAHYAELAIPSLAVLANATRGYRAFVAALAASRRPCTEDDLPVAPPSGRRAAVLVGGLGSTSETAAIDDLATGELGYRHPDVLRFSYSGGRTPDPTDGFAEVAEATYRSADTQGDLRQAGRRLADLVEDVAAGAPGVPIDLYAHSQGGLVVRIALVELETRHGAEWLGRLGLVATLGTPHGGADLATAVHAVGSTVAGSLALDGLQAALGLELDDDATSVTQLSETSDLVDQLGDHGVPEGVRMVSIAARGDLVVPVPRTAARGATHVVVPLVGLSAHDELPGSPEARREIGLALAGMPPGCQSFGSALADHAAGEAISWAEDAAGAASWLVAGALGPPIGG